MSGLVPMLAASLPFALAACGAEARGGSARWSGFDPGPTPVEFHRGEVVFNTFCLSCHGRHGTGEGLGPPLLDSLYAPSRLSDSAIVDAVERGVGQRNFRFGAMPPVPRVSRADAAEIVGYVRWIQQRTATTEPRDTSPTEVR